MVNLYALLVYGFLALGIIFVVDAIGRFVSEAGDQAVERRIAGTETFAPSGARESILRETIAREAWMDRIPFFGRFVRLVQESGTGITAQRAVTIMTILTCATFIALLAVSPAWMLPVIIVIAPAVGIGLVVFYLSRAKKKRKAQFEEQLPDAIDLIVRSLKIGHPLSGGMAVVGNELPPPISTEFKQAVEAVNYGQEISAAFQEMANRVGSDDLNYVSMAIQIHQESGGNLVESLSNLCNVIRERFRMFRKVKALTAEGRFSAWFLSIFPFFLIVFVQLIKPDYYTSVMNYPYFPHAVVATVILLIINIVAMRVITTIKV